MRRAIPLFLLASLPALAQNYLHTSGSKLVDAKGNIVRLTGINWFGMETANYCPHGLWSHSMGFYLDLVKAKGYNCIRLPYCNQLLDAGSTPNGIDYNQNPDLVGLTGLQIMDKVIAGCQARGIKVFLDRHRPDSSAQSALWYTSSYSESRWISDWKFLAQRYLGNDTVIGCDLHNEPHSPASWGDGTAYDWVPAAVRCGNAILGVNPRLLIIVEGNDNYANTFYWWGGQLAGAAAHPVQLSVPNQLVYSTHDYPASVYAQPWFSDPTYPDNLPALWDKTWGYLAKNGIAPVLVGEFGTKLATTSDQQWFNTLANYIKANGLNFTFWCLNPDSGDTGGLLADDWTTVIAAKQAVLAPLQAPFIGGGGTPTPTVPAAPTGLTAAAGNGQVTLAWTGSAGATSYNLYRGTTAGGESSTPVATGITGTSATQTGLANGTTYYFKVAAVNSAGTSPLSNEARATPSGASPTVPAAPTNLTAAAGNGQVTLAWTGSAGAASYNLYRGTAPGGESGTPVASGITGTTAVQSGLANGTTYYFKAAAVNSAGVSPLSNEARATPAGTTPGAGPLAAAARQSGSSGPYWGEDDLVITSTAPVTALAITVNVAVTSGLIFNGQYNTVGSQIVQGHTSGTTTLAYTFTLASGTTLPAGGYTFAAQYGLAGTAHAAAGDTYTIRYTAGGQSYSLSGHF